MPFSPEWIALGREADLAVEQLCSGINALGKANHAQTGLYAQAFFGLSIGFERLCKIAIVADYAIQNAGRYPNNKYLKSFGHDLESLVAKCDEISIRCRAGKDYWDRPRSDIHKNIVSVLSDFGKATRYYNLDFIGGKAGDAIDPIHAWWERVGEPILLRHADANSLRAKAQAEVLDMVAAETTYIRHTTEDGKLIIGLGSLIARGAGSLVVQKYGTFYVLQVARWISYLAYDLSQYAGYTMKIDGLFGVYERVQMFMHPDSVLRKRRRWSLYRR